MNHQCNVPTLQAAKRELKEETGLSACRVLGESPPVAMDPGMSSAMLSIITLEVDGDTEENVAAVKDAQAEDLNTLAWQICGQFHFLLKLCLVISNCQMEESIKI